MTKLLKKLSAIALLAILVFSITACKSEDNDKVGDDVSKDNGSQNTSDTTETKDPFGAYENEVVVSMGRQTLQNPKLPEGDTYEDNAYTRWLKDELNIKIVDE
ncbi:MAG TPA: sugar ABC transporter substrate-binding protein, partial [Clostridiales bacterium]|nr:sugar ABC transporter substrate-binding protein [Clostridiales bacterium]